MFEIPMAAAGITVVTPAPVPGPSLADAALAALSSSSGSVVVGGISFGAHLAAEWAVANPSRCVGLVLALPAWHGEPGTAPASRSALLSAAAVRSSGVAGALSGSELPRWLADELARAWHGYGDGLAESLEVAAARPAPTLAELATLDVPVGIAACADDPVHPASVADEWATALPCASVCRTRLSIMGVDREALGRAAVLAFLRAAGGTPGRTPCRR
ncbi:alpha/beta fold hydrolase [Actinophytocola sp.]|uniref:alpha/beta fold hydrolase n=1 Tax=Actinophytocola sp. TaxID=1872138 RepID=UPI003D6A9E70